MIVSRKREIAPILPNSVAGLFYKKFDHLDDRGKIGVIRN